MACPGQPEIDEIWMQLFAYNWKLPAYSELFYLQLTILAFLFTIGASLLTAFYLQFELFAYSASNKGLKEL